MFDFPTPYLDIWMAEPRRRFTKPTTIHRATCPHCDRKLVNVYYSSQIDKYICRECMSVLLGEKEKEKNMNCESIKKEKAVYITLRKNTDSGLWGIVVDGEIVYECLANDEVVEVINELVNAQK